MKERHTNVLYLGNKTVCVELVGIGFNFSQQLLNLISKNKSKKRKYQ